MRDLAQNNCDLQVVIEYKPRGPRTHMLLGSAAKTILGIHRMNVANFGVLQVFGHALFGGESSPSPPSCSRCVDQYEPVCCLEDPDFSRFAETPPELSIACCVGCLALTSKLARAHDGTRAGPALRRPPALLVIKSPWEAPYGLSARELHVLNGLAQRASNQRIASERSYLVRTVTTHVERILVKLDKNVQERPPRRLGEGFLHLHLMATLPVSPGPRFFGAPA